MHSRDHDAAVAVTSHVPHLMASLMAARLGEGPAGLARVAGQGLRDATRIAAGDSRLWGDILQANAPAVAGVLKDLHADLSRLVPALDALARGGAAERDLGMRTLVDLLERGISGLAGIPAAGHGRTSDDASPERHGVLVRVAERPGELARLIAAVTDLGGSAEDARAGLSGGGPGLTVRFAAPAGTADRLVTALAADGWEAVREDGGGRPAREGREGRKDTRIPTA